MIAATDQTCSELAAIVGAAQVSADVGTCAALSAGGNTPRIIVYPSSAEEVAAVLRYSSEHELAVIPCRNATKLMTGNPPRRYDIALSLKNLTRVRHFEPADLTISVEPGMQFGDFQNLAGEHKLWLPLDPAGGERSSIGGILAANSSGSLRTYYGTARDMTLGVRFATTEGKVVKAGGRVVKNVAGYDLTKLMIGSFGTLGVIVEASFKLFPVPHQRASFAVSAETPDKVRLIRREIQNSPIRPLRFVLVDSAMIGYLGGGEGAASSGGDFEFRVELAGTPRVLGRCAEELTQIASRAGETMRAIAGAEAEEAWRRLGGIHSSVSQNPRDWLLRILLPISSVEEFVSQARRYLKTKEAIARLHADPSVGSISVWLCAGPQESVLENAVTELRRLAGELGGSLMVEIAPASATGKIGAWGPCGNDFESMRKLKEALDPKGVLSPGRFVGGL